jgi:hypothetical protein
MVPPNLPGDKTLGRYLLPCVITLSIAGVPPRSASKLRLQSLGSVFCEDTLNYFLRYRLLRREKQIVDDGIRAVPHGKRIGHETESRDLLQSLAEGCDNHLIALLDKVGNRKKVLLWVLGVCCLLPGLVPPKSGHALDSALRDPIRISPDGIPIYVHDRKIEKHIDGL